MSTPANFTIAGHGDATTLNPRSDAELARIAQLLKVFTVSIAVLVLGGIATSQIDAPLFLNSSVVLSALVLVVTTLWLALKVYSFIGGIVVLILLLVTSLLTALTPIAPFALLGKLFILLSVRDKAAKILKKHTALANSTESRLALKIDSNHQFVVNSRFAWERWLFFAVTTVLVGMVAYSGYLSFLKANQ